MTTIPKLWLDHFPASEWGRTVNAKDAGQLVRPLRDAFWTLRRDVRDRGDRCEVASAYRTPWQQYRLRVGRVPDGMEFQCPPMGRPSTACPGRSRHQHRAALDLDMNDDGYDYLRDHAGLYGLGLTVPGERWHVEVVGPAHVPLLTYPGPSFDDDDQEVDDMALSDADIKKLALVTAATTKQVLEPLFTQLGLPVIAGVDRILDDEQRELLAKLDAVLDAIAADHGPA